MKTQKRRDNSKGTTTLAATNRAGFKSSQRKEWVSEKTMLHPGKKETIPGLYIDCENRLGK